MASAKRKQRRPGSRVVVTRAMRARALKAQTAARAEVLSLRPVDAEQLHVFVREILGIDVPRRPLAPGSSAPFDYLLHTFFEAAGEPTADCVVWANRGGGKTHLGAVATLLDLLFKPGIQVRILGGSLEQSSRMYEHLRRMAELPMVRPMVEGEPTQRRVALVNGSVVELLAQSQRSVRGTRVHKLRCDEVEEFDPEVWRAAQLVTRSGMCGRVAVRGAVESLSTMHRPFGLMSRLVDAAGGAKIFRWCAMDVIERCPPSRACDTCVLWPDCGGAARGASGFVGVEDLMAQRRRCSDDAWASEMMCRRPRRDASVYPKFEPGRHVAAADFAALMRGGATVVGGMDFGLRSPLVMLWAVVERGQPGADAAERGVTVIDEHVERGLTIDEHVARIGARDWPTPAWLGVDPAGGQRNSQTGLSDIQVLRRHGHVIRARRGTLRDGIERIRRRLDRGTLRIDPRCVRLIEALTMYHFDPQRPERDEPVKDGPDHVCDALRYLIVNLELGGGRVEMRSYF